MSSVNRLSPNNHGPLPGNPTRANDVHTYTRDPKYYYPDANAVFSAEGVLFRLQASLILPPDSSIHRQLADSSDTNPIALSDVTASQFRNYLFVLLGRPFDPEYVSLLARSIFPQKNDPDLLIRYLDTSCLARQFGMFQLEKWAQSKLGLVLQSTYKLAESNWDKSTLLRINSYARSTGIQDLISSTTTFIQYFISVSASEETDPDKGEHVSSNLNTCVQLYKDPNLPNDDPAIFGCVFASILSLGHRSITWTSTLTRRDRAILYAAQVQLAILLAKLECLGWLRTLAPSSMISKIERSKFCGKCKERLPELWRQSFGQCGTLDSNSLKNVTALARLPQYRRHFWDKSRNLYSPSPWTVGNQATTCRGGGCASRNLIINEIDPSIQQAYTELAHQYEVCSDEV